MGVKVVLIAGAGHQAGAGEHRVVDGIERARALRREVFVDGFGYTLEEEFDDLDWNPGIVHALAVEASGEGTQRDLGTARLVSSAARPGVVRFTRVGVVEDARGRGIGRTLVAALEALALAEFCSGNPSSVRIELSAMEPAVPFYETLGYDVNPERYLEVRKWHQAASKELVGQGR